MAISDPVSLGRTFSSASATSYTHVTEGNVPSGALIVVPVLWVANAAITVTLSGGGLTWTADKTVTGVEGIANNGLVVFSAQAPSGLASGTTLTATFSANNSWGCTIMACYATGLVTSNVVDGTPPGRYRDAPTAAWTSTTQTTTNPNDLLIGVGFADGGNVTSTPAATDTELIEVLDTTNNWTSTLTYRIVAATGTYEMSGTWSAAPNYNDVAAMVAYIGAQTDATGPGQMGWGTFGGGNLGPSYGETIAGTAWEQNVADTVAVADSIRSDPHARVADTLTTSDVLTRDVTRLTADSITVTDATTRAIQTAPADSITVADTVATEHGRTQAIADSITVADATAHTVAASLADTLALSDNTTTELTSGGTGLEHSVADTLAVTDATAMTVTAAVADSLVVTDSLARQIAAVTADTLAVADNTTTDHVAGGTAHEQSVGDAIAVADSLSLLAALQVADSLAVADAVTTETVTAHQLQIADTLAAADVAAADRPLILVRGKPRISIGGGLYV